MPALRFAPLVLFSLVAAQSTGPVPPALRLPSGVTPASYAIRLRLDPNQADYNGTVTIHLNVQNPAPVIWVNATSLTMDKAAANISGKDLAGQILKGNDDFAGFAFDPPVPAGKAILTIDFHGQVTTQTSSGLFRGKDGGNNYIYTQFEPIDARRAFPCFDEPQFKVPWQLTLEVPETLEAVANTPIQRSTAAGGGFKRVEFAQSPPMPSYLVAFAAGPFEFADAGKAGSKQVPVRIVVPKGRSAEARYAVETTVSVVNKLEEYFGIPFPYAKLDQIAVPLFGGAMENPGLITYADSLILAKPEDDSISRRRGWISVASHELAHQWFGDLVTMAWWDDLWLNEGFATWMGDTTTAKLKPEWKIEGGFAASRNYALSEDSLLTARRVRQPIDSKNDIVNAFDSITYQKGGAVLRMMEAWLGQDKFRQGVRNYLQKHAWGNATSKDFLAAMAGVGGPEVAEAFASFLDQGGAPEVSFSLLCEPGKRPELTLRQTRALPVGTQAPGSQTWKVPVCVEYPAASEVARQCSLLTTTEAKIGLDRTESCPAWIVPNASGAGYYRSRMDSGLLHNLMEEHFPAMTLQARIALVGDVAALTRSGSINTSDALKLVPKLAAAQDRQIVEAAISLAVDNSDILSDEDVPRMDRYIVATFGPRARQLGWLHKPGDDDDTRQLRAQLVPFVAGRGDPELGPQAKPLALKWIEDRKSLPADLAPGVLRAAAVWGDAALFDAYLNAIKNTEDRRQRSWLFRGLGSFRQPELVQRALRIPLDPAFDLRESFGLLFAGGRPPTQHAAFDFVRENYAALLKRMPTSIAGGSFAANLPYTGQRFCSAAGRSEVKDFFESRIEKETGGPRTLAQVLESIGQCAALKARQGANLHQFLAAW
ncbi:MAG: M1 family metallopeptidase [Bryobacterales bacterium]|nr:M1 family metallopeptidase [Bryobacterales bacterium]